MRNTAVNPATTATLGKAAQNPRPCHVTASNPRMAQVVGRARDRSRAKPGRTNAGSHSPPSMDTPRMTRMHTLRARASVPPTAATSMPVAAASPLAATASSTNPATDPPTVTPNARYPTPNVTPTIRTAMTAVDRALPSSTHPSGTGAARVLAHTLRWRSRSSSSPLSIPQNSRYCRVMPLKLWA
ncbi:MAG: hypothetical protein ABGY75_13425 [Gemmataceae bacterium]